MNKLQDILSRAKEQEAHEIRKKMAPDELKLRELLAQRCAGLFLYCDDGELQDNSEYPLIDFLRDSPDQIRASLSSRILKRAQICNGK